MKFFKKLASFFMALVVAFGIIPLAKCTEVAGGADETEKTAQTQPKVSVLIPVYKVEPYLRQCLDSVVNQTLKDIEIICVDDGSPDNCGKILDEYAAKDPRIKVIHQKNMGSALARQTGLDVATGEYIKFVDSDDYIDLRTLEICYNEAKKDDVDILIHGSYQKSSRWMGKNRFDTGSMSCIFKGQCFEFDYDECVWNKLYRTRFIVKSGVSFYGVMPMMEDGCFNRMIYPHANVVKVIPDMLYYYRCDNITSLVHSTRKAVTCKDHLNNIGIVYKHWYSQRYFTQAKAKVSFLNWALNINFWPKDMKINKMFYDTLNSLDANLIRDKQVISTLSKRNKVKLAAIMKFAEPANKKQVAVQKRKPAPKNHITHRRARRR